MESYELGVNSYIVKPVDFDQFTESVRQLGFYWLLLNQPPPNGPRVERRRGRAAAVEADLGHPVVGRGEVPHRGPEDAPPRVARADDRDVKRLPRLIVRRNPAGELLAGFSVERRQSGRRSSRGNRRGPGASGRASSRLSGVAASRALAVSAASSVRIGARELVEDVRLHESPELSERDDPVFREGLREGGLHPLVVRRVQRFGRPVPLDEPEGTHERADVGESRASPRGPPGRGEDAWRRGSS